MRDILPLCSIAIPCRWLACLAMLFLGSKSHASTLIYLTGDGAGEGAAPMAMQTLAFAPGTGSFHIWVQPDVLFTGVSLDVEKVGPAIRFTGSTVHNPMVGSDTRWLPGLIRNGTVTDDQVSRIEGGALAPLTGSGTGIGPTTSGFDPLYESGGGFLFATIDFEVISPASTATASLSIGHNLLSDTDGLTTSSILLGVGDGPVANSPGATGAAVDLTFMGQSLHPSDYDSDGDVDGDDLLTWQTGFGITSGALRTQGDGNSDGKVDGVDLTLWESQYGTTPSPLATVSTVPEASAIMILVCGMLSQFVARQR